MKVSLPDQIEEAELHRQALEKASIDKPALAVRRDRSEAILLTLHSYAAFEAEIQSTNTTKGR